MKYLTGYTVKPYQINSIGKVLFTDGTNNNITPNESQCNAYGYTYNKASGTCMAFRPSLQLTRSLHNINNKLNGVGNSTEVGSNMIQINGTKNTTKGLNNNCLISGSYNTIESGVNDATVLGIGGTADRDGGLVIGGGLEVIGTEVITNCLRKVSTVNLAGTTTDNTPTKLTVNGIGGTNYINVNENSIVGFEIYITRLEVGGSSSTLGNYSYKNIKGVVRVGETSGMAFIVGFTRNIGKIGVNGTTVMVDSTTGGIDSISIEVTDRNNVTNIWSASVTLNEIKTTEIRF